MPLLKILCIFATTVGLSVSSTSPNPPLRSSARTIAPTSIFHWCSAIAETTIIVAQLSPRCILSQMLVSALSLGGDLPTMRLTPPLALGSMLVASGALLRLQCYRALGKHFTFETGILQKHKLITTGPYSFVRHPSYTGAMLAYFGLLLSYGSRGSWFVECLFKGSAVGSVFCASYLIAMTLVVSGLLSRISKEDEGLRREFGQEWTVWSAQVPYALIPGVY
ncbi:hypothetical protein B0H19DRAFT_1212536 [Mycena capillaripes]|nr:hypothetical protein B0H19DRAFT_1212536 [Mycena capillaripes]